MVRLLPTDTQLKQKSKLKEDKTSNGKGNMPNLGHWIG
jgi:hypothetical protein